MDLRITGILLIMLTSFLGTSQELMYNAFIEDSIAVGNQANLVITLEQADAESISQIQIDALQKMSFYGATASQSDSIVSEDADISINSFGLWEDKNKDGILTDTEIKWDKVQNGDSVLYRNTINISFFDVGIYIFDGFPFTINNRTAKTNRALMKVTFKEYDLAVIDSTGLAPIKDIARENLSIRDFLPILLYILIPLLLFYFLYKYYKKQKARDQVEVEEEVIYIPPDVQALTQLKDLRGKQLWQKGEIKQYQSELSHIIRGYLEGRYSIKALENTTSQIIRSINDKSFTKEDQEKLKRILQISDLVKFAKAKPEVNIHEEFMNDAVEFVRRTKKPIVHENEEEE
ncbi:hypothetical protein [Portibacter lacus]|uniref:Protein BatD n=1 Tax=Portibacter lacus TaxID=1099794 RepID=A0AA37SRZ2_9BACT|nr:hypothetical protein [Portibacter lacus]GLR17028.1 hypothetical protein GCM10007940_16430 [Portibacter lacus]